MPAPSPAHILELASGVARAWRLILARRESSYDNKGGLVWLGAVAAAALLLAAFAAPMSAAPNKTSLSAAVVSPRTGTTATTILISAVYRNAADRARTG